MIELTGRYLVLPDVHQNLPWVQTVLDREARHVEGVVLLGDYFDAKIANPPSAADTAVYFAKLERRLGKPVHFLVGNHDLPYLYDAETKGADLGSKAGNPYPCNTYDPAKSESIAKAWPRAFRRKLRTMILANGYLLSHAGLHPDFLPNPTRNALDDLERQLQDSLHTALHTPHPALASVSPIRGGLDPVGGVTWLDWRHEFEDSLPWPQIVGHTALEEPQQRGRSWNLDTKGRYYAILDEQGLEARDVDTL